MLNGYRREETYWLQNLIHFPSLESSMEWDTGDTFIDYKPDSLYVYRIPLWNENLY